MTTIPIYLIADEQYATCLAGVLHSVLQHTSRDIHFYVLDGGLKLGTQNLLCEMVQKLAPSSVLDFLPVDESRFEGLPDIGHFSRKTYYRYLIPGLHPSEKKALYLDCDILVCGDVGELYDTELGDYPLGAVPYRYELMPTGGSAAPLQKWGRQLKQKVGLPQTHTYFNAGVLLLNCEAMRQLGWEQRLFEKTQQLAQMLECPDQDVLNLMCVSGYRPLEHKWNAVVDVDWQLGVQHAEQPYILHFTGGYRMRPWLSVRCPWAAAYRDCIDQTPFAACFHRGLLENELSHQQEVLATLLDASVKLRRSLFIRLVLWLVGQGKQNSYIVRKLKALQRTIPSQAV